MPDTTVKYFSSTMSGAPALSGTAGALIGVLDACLVNGFGSVTLTSLAVASNVATATVSGGHNFAMVGNTGPVITIAGATPSALNGQWRIASVPGSTTFTFATTGISDQTATGTITAKRSPAGWSKVFSGTNKGAYRSTSLDGTNLYLQVLDNVTIYTPVCIYESMSDVDTGTDKTPSNTLYVAKSSNINLTANPWHVIADDRMMYCFFDASSAEGSANRWASGLVFGDLITTMSGDAYHCMICASASNTSVYGFGLSYLGGSANSSNYVARDYSQINKSVSLYKYTLAAMSPSYIGINGQAYPHPGDGKFHAWPCVVYASSAMRGILPGFWCPAHASQPPHGTIINGDPDFLGHDLLVLAQWTGSAANSRVAIDITGPWR